MFEEEETVVLRARDKARRDVCRVGVAREELKERSVV